MTSKVKVLIGVAVFAAIIAGALLAYSALRERVKPDIGLAEGPGSVPVPATDRPETPDSDGGEPSEQGPLAAPDFTVWDADGETVKLSDMAGTPVVVNFWASWCPPCKEEMPWFETVYLDLGGDVAFMMINMTDGERETRETGESYVAGKGFTFPVYYDMEQEAAYTYGIRSLPTTLFIDGDGYLITGAEGALDEDTLRYGISLITDGAAG